MKGAYIPLDVLDNDLDNDGRPDQAVLWHYHPKFDINFDKQVGDSDVSYVNSQMNQLLDLNSIRASMFTGETKQLVWPDGWTAQLRAAIPMAISKFVGTKMSFGWLHGTRYPYSDATGFYECYQYGADLALAAYKALGYGAILAASSNAGAGLSHMYNAFFLGDDWHKIENWRLIEPQDGALYGPGFGKQNAMYNTDTIYFYGDIGSSGQIVTHTLHVDASGIVSFGNPTAMSYVGLLESTPDYFDVFLGAEGGDELTLDAKARIFARLHPTHNNGPWDGWCAALMARMCIAYGDGPIPIPSTAKIAAGLAGKLNLDASKAPIGAFHYWQYGVDGHVGLDTKGGGTSVFMASSYLKESLGNGLGFQSVKDYARNGQFPYLGWSPWYGKNGRIAKEVPVTTPTTPPIVTPPAVSVANKAEVKLIDLHIIDPGHDMNGVPSWGAMVWTIYRLLQYLGKV